MSVGHTVFLNLHRNPSEGICDGADQDDHRKNRAEVLNHDVENFLSAERAFAVQYLFLNAFDTDYFGNQQADSDGGNGHHNGVGQEIKEIQKLHAENFHIGERSVAQGRKASQKQHDHTDQNGCFFSAPAQFVLKGRNGAFRQSNGAGNGCKKHQKKE